MTKRVYAAKLYADGTANAEPAADKVGAIDYTAFAAALATLVADGATPTQAHVTAANSAWTTLKALIDTATGQVSSNLIVAIDDTVFTSHDKLERALQSVWRAGRHTGQFV